MNLQEELYNELLSLLFFGLKELFENGIYLADRFRKTFWQRIQIDAVYEDLATTGIDVLAVLSVF